MRTYLDRFRHSLLYEGLLLAVTIPLFTLLFNQSFSHIGILSLVLSLTAMGWNYLYNLVFDNCLKGLGHPLYPRSFRLRIIHALFFETGLLFVSVPAIMCWMNFTLLQALTLDLSFIILVPFYTIIYNYIYDRIFPVRVSA